MSVAQNFNVIPGLERGFLGGGIGDYIEAQHEA